MLDIEYDLATDRGFVVTARTPSMSMFHHYAAYRKERTEAAQARQAEKNKVVMHNGGRR